MATFTELAAHPLADLFPMGEPGELRTLAASIREVGLLEPIITYEDMILDGRRRYKACCMASVGPVFVKWSGECGTPEEFVIVKNIRRRHQDVESLVKAFVEIQKRKKKELRQFRADEEADEGERQEHMFAPEQLVEDMPAIADLPPEEQIAAVREAEAAAERTGVDEDRRTDQEPRSVKKWVCQFRDLHGSTDEARQRAHARLDEIWAKVSEERRKKRRE